MLKAGFGADGGEVTPVTWQYFDDMHEALGGRASLDPPVVVASFSTDPDSKTSFELKTVSRVSSPNSTHPSGSKALLSPVIHPLVWFPSGRVGALRRSRLLLRNRLPRRSSGFPQLFP